MTRNVQAVRRETSMQHTPGRRLMRPVRSGSLLCCTATLTLLSGLCVAADPADAGLASEVAAPIELAAAPVEPTAADPLPESDVVTSTASLPATTAAGRTQGTIGVTSAGAASYSIPIWTPPGVGDVDLHLSLDYNSRSPNGVAGLGWSLRGLSAITICHQTFAQNGAANPAGRPARLCLDGQQLKLVSGTYGTAGALYATEVESFARISQVSAGLGSGFVVTTRNGLVYEYGTSANSQIYLQDGAIRAWALASIRDRQSPIPNRISLTYHNDASNGSYRIASIAYPTTATGQGPYYEVDFSYSIRDTSDVAVGYFAGSPIREPNQLNAITIRPYGSAGVTRSYQLNYAGGRYTARLLLTSVTECSATNCLRPTTFTYRTGNGAWAAAQKSANNASSAVAPIPLDLNGDGLMDLLYPVASGISNSRWWAMLATTSGFNPGFDTLITTANNARLMVGQFSGRGQNQLLFVRGGYWTVATFNGYGSGFATASTGVPLGGEFSAVDWDGDGLPDLASVDAFPANTTVRIRRNVTAPGGVVAFSATAIAVWNDSLLGNGSGAIANGWIRSLMTDPDFNGDGRGDLIIYDINLQSPNPLITLFSNGFDKAARAVGLPDAAGGMVYGDVNGDGCTDLLALHGAQVSDCDGGFAQINASPALQTGATLWLDQNGDGRTDILYVNRSNADWYVMQSQGDGFSPPRPLGFPAPNGTAWFVTDINGDGLADMAYRDDANSGRIKWRLHYATAAPADALESVTDGFGLSHVFAYTPTTQANYTKYNTATFPEIDIAGPLYVVGKLTRNSGTSAEYYTLFDYYGARQNLQGRGFEGFAATRILDSRNSLLETQYRGQAFPYTGMPVQRTVTRTNQSIKIAESKSTLAFQALGSGFERRFFPYVQGVTESHFELGGPIHGARVTETVANLTYGDSYGNLTQITRTVTDRDPGSPYLATSWTTAINASYYNNTSTNCLGLPQTVAETRSAPGKTPMTRTTSYGADTAACRTTQQTVEPNTPELKVQTSLEFDGCGNASAIKVVGANWDGTALPERSTRIDYGSRCQRPETVTNALGQVLRLAYRYDLAVPVSVTDANLLVTSWQYDDFGRRISESRPDNTKSTLSFVSCASSGCLGASFPDARLRARAIATGGLGDVYDQRDRYYDGRELLTAESYTRALGVSTTRALTHDAFGRVTALYNPVSAGASNGYTAWDYDSIGRVQSEKRYNSSGVLDRTSSYVYAGRTTTVTDPLGNVRSVVTDVSGQLRQVTEPSPGGTTSFDYDSFGNRIRIQDPSGAASSGVANVRGFRTQWTDADRGAWLFKPDSFGELVKWSDARGQSFSATFDALGRVTSRTEPEGTSTWTWGSSASKRNIGQLERVAGYGYAENLAYDDRGRLSTRTITTDQAYAYDYAYDANGFVGSVTYPSSPVPTGRTGTRFKARYYYSFGSPVAITDASEPAENTLWALTAANDYGSPTMETLGGGTAAIASGYKTWTGELTSSTVGKAPATADRQNLAYQWDVAGNLTQRQDRNQAITEAFTYDALHRVTRSTRNGVPNLSLTYDAAGNITSKSDVGSYAYLASAHPHAVTAAGSHTFTYDANGNQATRDGAPQTWASFNLPTVLAQPINGTTYQARFNYGPNHERWKQIASYSNGTETTQYIGGLLEKESTTSTNKTYWRHYVATPSGRIIVSRNSDLTTTTLYAIGDHLGSTDTVLDGNANTVARESYATFGARRGSDWSSTTAPDWAGIANSTRHGYTGHEHLDNLNLIHMGGRVYDPAIGRVLSVDPLIGDLTDSQSINPYAYVGNRPLTAIDPTGYEPVGLTIAAQVFVSWAMGTLFGGGPPKRPPPATNVAGISAQNGVAPCSGGSSSPACDGSLISPDTVAGSDQPPIKATSGWRWVPQANARLADMLDHGVTWVGDNLTPVPLVLCIFDAGLQDCTSTQWRHGAVAAVLTPIKVEATAVREITVLGKFPNYIQLADELGAKRFNIPTSAWNRMSQAEQWAANRKFLDRAIIRGDDIVLSNPVKNINDVTGAFRQELDYLINNGFRLSVDGTRLAR